MTVSTTVPPRRDQVLGDDRGAAGSNSKDQDPPASRSTTSSEDLDKDFFNKDTNRIILRNLMENGIRDATGSHVGKTIIFARNHNHAVHLAERLQRDVSAVRRRRSAASSTTRSPGPRS